jgi:hypothetical protein
MERPATSKPRRPRLKRIALGVGRWEGRGYTDRKWNLIAPLNHCEKASSVEGQEVESTKRGMHPGCDR